MMTTELLSRIQFAFTLTFHYIYPPLSIGLSLALVLMEGMYLYTKDPLWEKLTKFWLKVFAMTFALGVVTGIPLEFSLGTNWARYSRYVGDVFGSLLGAEGFFAFLIEAGFLGVLLFGWDKVSKKIHFLSTLLVCFGSHFSAIWIVAVNSWMQTPKGHVITTAPDGVVIAQVESWWEVFLNYSSISHILHVVFSAWLTAAFLIISVAGYYLLKNKHFDFAQRSLKLGVLLALSSSFLQLAAADDLTRRIARHNPEKFAAFEGVYETIPYTPSHVVGWVDGEKEKVYGIKIPGLLSFLTYHEWQTPVKGLREFPKDQWPWVPVVFQMYHLMILMWGLMLSVSFLGAYLWWKGKWQAHPWILRIIILSVVFPQIANITGWYTACMGRQPWTVYKLLKTSDAYSLEVSRGEVLASLIMFVTMYLLFLVLFLYLLDQKIKHGPLPQEEQLPYKDPFKEEKPHG